MVDFVIELVKALLIIFPAYAANGFPPLARGRHSIDLGKNFRGNRLFGDGKTFEGFFLGLVAGTIVGLLEFSVYPFMNSYALASGVQLPMMTPMLGFLISFGALSGDLVGSFIKRRFGLSRGKEFFLLDQWNFIVGSMLLVAAFTEITIWMAMIMLLITLVVHRTANIIGHRLRVKREPW